MARYGVTGAAGFVAGHLVASLLESGHEVVGTLPNAASKLKLVEADLLNPDAFAGCFEGCDAGPADALMKPAVDGTTNVYKACAMVPTIKRIVTTSSFATIIFGHDHTVDPRPYTEADHNTRSSSSSAEPVEIYRASKIAAEQAACGFAAPVTIHPPFIIGPWLPGYTRQNESSMMLARLRAPAPGGIGIVDVRDVARAHIQAMESPQAQGRYLVSAGSCYWTELEGLVTHLRALPSAEAMRADSFEPAPPSVVGPLKPLLDCSKAQRDLGWQPRHSLATAVREQMASLREAGLV